VAVVAYVDRPARARGNFNHLIWKGRFLLPASAARHGIVNRTEQFKMASMVIASITSSVKV
jgi:hypothetical protein